MESKVVDKLRQDLVVKVTVDGLAARSEQIGDMIAEAIQESARRAAYELYVEVFTRVSPLQMSRRFEKQIEDFHIQAFFRAVFDKEAYDKETAKLRLEVYRLQGEIATLKGEDLTSDDDWEDE